MKPASPVIRGYDEVVYAKDQPQYNPLPSIKLPDGLIVTRWAMTWRERLRCLFTGSVYLEVLTFNQPLQPLKMSVAIPDEFAPSKRLEIRRMDRGNQSLWFWFDIRWRDRWYVTMWRKGSLPYCYSSDDATPPWADNNGRWIFGRREGLAD